MSHHDEDATHHLDQKPDFSGFCRPGGTGEVDCSSGGIAGTSSVQLLLGRENPDPETLRPITPAARLASDIFATDDTWDRQYRIGSHSRTRRIVHLVIIERYRCNGKTALRAHTRTHCGLPAGLWRSITDGPLSSVTCPQCRRFHPVQHAINTAAAEWVDPNSLPTHASIFDAAADAARAYPVGFGAFAGVLLVGTDGHQGLTADQVLDQQPLYRPPGLLCSPEVAAAVRCHTEKFGALSVGLIAAYQELFGMLINNYPTCLSAEPQAVGSILRLLAVATPTPGDHACENAHNPPTSP